MTNVKASSISDNAQPLIEARDLVKVFGGLRAVDGMSIALNRGEMLGLIGPNGAGKTTLFNLLAGLWRRIGGDCHALFRAPLRSTSLTEFWGRRWNLAFSEMTALTVYRPLRRLTGNRLASIVAFLFSGVLHELAISLPVRQGYGLPTLYFVLHAIAMQIENVLADCGKPINSSRLAGRCWTAVWLVLPLPLLFHVPFLRGCLWPLLGLNLPGLVGH